MTAQADSHVFGDMAYARDAVTQGVGDSLLVIAQAGHNTHACDNDAAFP